ncbi:MAG: NAD(P)/FAD-dependent oxidoreductase [Bacteroidia bacterium]|nr:MAG: NAD(P)/FAD-dependent oxidoreductase [Bacteroidia bacterium]
MTTHRRRIVILGGGFAGLQLARRLDDKLFDITLIDQNNFHQFQPLFYQVATARLEPSAISFPLRKIFQNNPNVHVRLATVERLIPNHKIVVTSEGNFNYDFLVIATGCRTNFFGNKKIERYAFPMKSTQDSIALRNRILLNFEESIMPNANKEELLNFVIAGGGPTGVELAGALIEMKKNVLPKDYPNIDFSSLTIYLIEGANSTLASMSTVSQQASISYLRNMGVIVMTQSLIEDFDGTTVYIKGGKEIRTKNLIWAAGVMGNVPQGLEHAIIMRGNRIKVDEYNNVLGEAAIYAIGDVAYMPTKDWENGHPQLANVANNQAKNLAINFKKLVLQKKLSPFLYINPGTMATIGKRKAVVDLPTFSFQGFFAWLFWMFLHLMLILSVKNKLFIFINWAISYFTNDTTLRLILLPTTKQIELFEERKKELA